jgi:ferredoxin-NADP reductase
LKSSIKDWRSAKVVRTAKAADDIMSIELSPEAWIPHKAGQHYELRLPNHHLSRKYSIVSSPHHKDRLEFGVQLLPYGEVSPKLWELKPGDAVQIRGPLGSFVWMPEMKGPLIMIGGGSGITPLLSMYEHYRHTNPTGQVMLIASAKHDGRVMHHDRYKGQIVTRFTAQDGRIDKPFLEGIISKFASDPTAYCLTCGPGGFTGEIIKILNELGFKDPQIRRETFN